MIKHRITALIAVLAVIFISFPYGDQAYAGGKTQTAQSYMQATERGPAHLRHEALNWACAQKGKYIDADGAYGAQCVDLIYAYYEYLGVGRRGGNGADYQYDDKLPAGWVFKEYDSLQGFYYYTDPSGNYEISVFRRDDYGLYDLEAAYSFIKDYDMGMIILKHDRDWYIFADANHMTAYCEGKKGGLFGMNLYFSPSESNRVLARRIISSVDDSY